MERLYEGLGRGFVLVCAPAGSGKTALLADWARRRGRPRAWLSLDAGDNDPARFWRHVVAALDGACPGIGDRMAPLLGPPPSSSEALATAVINELAARPGEDGIVLVLDDYHLVGSGPVHASVDFLLEHLPHGLHLVLASRADPPLSLARLRARGQLTEIRDAELRFTAGEGAAMLREAAGADLADATVAALSARTEGWAAGLQLAALAMRGQADVPGFVASFTGSHRYVLDYLAEEVFEQRSDEERAFLLETSVLERLSGSLCDQVTGRAGSQALLEQVEQAGLFLVPLDDVRGWWRYHHLFADLLRVRLLAEQPARASQLHRNAAAWCDEHGLADDAISHAVAAGEMLWAARLIERHFDTLYSLRGEGATIQRWLSALPADLVRSRTRLLLAQALMAAASGRVEALEPLLDGAENASPGAADEPFEPTIGRADSMLVNAPALIALNRAYLTQLRGDAGGTARFASRAMAELGEGERLLGSVAQWNLAVAEWLRGRLAEAERAFASSIAGWQAACQHLVTAWGGYELGQVQRGQGRLDAAIQTCQQALEITAVPGQPPIPAAGPAYVGLGEVSYQRNELDTAIRHTAEGIELCRQFVYAPPLATGLMTLAWIRQATGDPDGALQAIDEAAQAAPGPPGLLNLVPSQRARLLLVQGDLAGAARWTSEEGLHRGRRAGLPQGTRAPGPRPGAARPRSSRPALALLDRLHGRRPHRTGSAVSSRPASACAGPSGQRRGNHRADGPVPSAYPGLPPGLCPGLRR